MTGPTLAVALAAMFVGGFYLALVVRAWFSERAHRRISAAAEALDPDALARLREYIAVIDDKARGAIDGGRKPVAPPPKPSRDSTTGIHFPSDAPAHEDWRRELQSRAGFPH